jgi:hypothetical protein
VQGAKPQQLQPPVHVNSTSSSSNNNNNNNSGGSKTSTAAAAASSSSNSNGNTAISATALANVEMLLSTPLTIRRQLHSQTDAVVINQVAISRISVSAALLY